jgi:hypothetical protein
VSLVVGCAGISWSAWATTGRVGIFATADDAVGADRHLLWHDHAELGLDRLARVLADVVAVLVDEGALFAQRAVFGGGKGCDGGELVGHVAGHRSATFVLVGDGFVRVVSGHGCSSCAFAGHVVMASWNQACPSMTSTL